MVSKPKQVASQARDEIENVISRLGSEHKDCNDKLSQHATDDGVPSDLAAVSRSCVEHGQHDHQPEQRDGPVGTGIVFRFFRDERSDQDDRNRHECSQWEARFRRKQLVDAYTAVIPHEMHWLRHDRDGSPEKDDAKRYGQVKEERDQPSQIIAVENQARNPPSVPRSEHNDEGGRGRRTR